jgi:hypothetical protein
LLPAEDELRGIAQGLCNFNGKQLQAVSHLLTDAHIKEIKIGMDIPPTNQVCLSGSQCRSTSSLPATLASASVLLQPGSSIPWRAADTLAKQVCQQDSSTYAMPE